MKQKVFLDREIPKLLLSGNWLSEAGFKPDDSARVAVYKNTLVVRNVKNDKEDDNIKN
ncbi:SymE family type I addiction module toxin [Chitinophaga sp. CF118]|uniref:SymE family type I addiction module toxin n=1 Tax=Chitinophaga sp. CF118 TaxID=1884367 RepID=UPI0015A617C1|nr:SymE family type I addiction module toxin [Chitinophaga sp. CF118]